MYDPVKVAHSTHSDPVQACPLCNPYKEGDRVELKGPNALYHGCAHGTITAAYNDGREDSLTVLLDNGIYTAKDPSHLRREDG